MPDKQSYSTKARKYILGYLEECGENTVSAADIINYLKEKNAAVNPATVYRCLNRLSEERGFMKEIKEHLLKSHGFALRCEGSVLYGICRDCAEE